MKLNAKQKQKKNANKNKFDKTEATKLNYLLHPRHSINIR